VISCLGEREMARWGLGVGRKERELAGKFGSFLLIL